MPPQEGKACLSSTPVATPTGWVDHGDLRPGDHVFHPSGKSIKVVAVSEPTEATIELTFSDHSVITCHPAHEWVVQDRSSHKTRTVEASELLGTALRSGPPGRGGRYRFSLPSREVLETAPAALPCDPYALGVWLGNGTTGEGTITHAPDDHYDIPYPIKSSTVHRSTGCVRDSHGGLYRALREAGVLRQKHIPPAYLRASEAQRRALLAGLIDTDGHQIQSGQVSFDNTNEGLVRSCAELLRTLGYRAHVHRPTPAKLGGMIDGHQVIGRQDMWRVTFTPHDQLPARLERKRGGSLARTRRAVSIIGARTVPAEPANCIQVDSPDGLYLVGEHMTPTHNSTLVQRGIAWKLWLDRKCRIVLVSYADDLVRRQSSAVRDLILTHPDRLGMTLRGDTRSKSEWKIVEGGGVFAVGVGGAIAGSPADVLIIDDPIKGRAEAESKAMREHLQDWWTGSASTRLAPDAPVIVIATRWHEKDLHGFLQEQEDGEQWRYVNIPAEAETSDDILGRAVGEFMISARGRSEKDWKRRKVTTGARDWAALFQGRPAPIKGDILKKDEWRQYLDAPWIEQADGSRWVPPSEDQEMILSVDCTFKDLDTSDYVVFQAWMRRGPNAYLLDQVRDRMDFTETCDRLVQFVAKWPQADLKLIEDKANGTAVIATLRTRIPGMVPENPTESKIARAHAITPFMAAGNVHIPDPKIAPWVGEFIEECAGFPNAGNDDQVDATTQAVRRLLVMPFIEEEEQDPDEDQAMADLRGFAFAPY